MSEIAPTVSSTRDIRIKPRRPVDVDAIRPQPFQALDEVVFHGSRPIVDTVPASGWVAEHAERHAQSHVFASAPGSLMLVSSKKVPDGAALSCP